MTSFPVWDIFLVLSHKTPIPLQYTDYSLPLCVKSFSLSLTHKHIQSSAQHDRPAAVARQTAQTEPEETTTANPRGFEPKPRQHPVTEETNEWIENNNDDEGDENVADRKRMQEQNIWSFVSNFEVADISMNNLIQRLHFHSKHPGFHQTRTCIKAKPPFSHHKWKHFLYSIENTVFVLWGLCHWFSHGSAGKY